jgi:hypothetical protein
MKSIKIRTNKVLKQIMAENEEHPIIGRSDIWLIARKKGDEIGEVIKHPYTSLARTDRKRRSLLKRDGKDSGWVSITSNDLARCGFVWL